MNKLKFDKSNLQGQIVKLKLVIENLFLIIEILVLMKFFFFFV